MPGVDAPSTAQCMLELTVAVVMWVVVGATVFSAYIAVHELGHAGAARLIGVPADRVAVRLFE